MNTYKIFHLVKKITLNGFVMLLSVFVTILFLDYFYGMYLRKEVQNKNLKFNEIRYVILKESYPPNYTIKITPQDLYMKNTSNLEQKPYKITTDSNSYIIGEDDDLLEANKKLPVDIIFFGGSTTECGYVDENKRFPALTAKLLYKEGKNIKTLNGGVSGNHSMHSLIQYIAKGVPLKPKYVVFMENINDLVLLMNTGSYWEAPKTRKFIEMNQINDHSSFASEKHRSSGYHFIYERAEFLFPNLSNLLDNIVYRQHSDSNDEWAAYRERANLVNMGNIEKEYKSAIVSIIHIVRSFGSEPILMTQFNRIRYQDNFSRNFYDNRSHPIPYDNFVNEYAKFNEIVRKVAAEEGVFLIDLEKLVPPNNKYMYDSVHLNNEGSELVANIVAKQIATHDANFHLSKNSR